MEAVTLTYSSDGRVWSKVLDRGGRVRVFPANYDSDSQVTQYLDRLLEAWYRKVLPPHHTLTLPRYIRVSPARWHASIGLRLEILGCYRPYPHTTIVPPFSTLPSANISCPSCPGLLPPPASCSCPLGALYDGKRCVAPQECPCYVGQAR